MAILTNIWLKIKPGLKTWSLVATIVLLGTFSFGLGRLSGLRAGNAPISFDYPSETEQVASLGTLPVKKEAPPIVVGESHSIAPISVYYVGSRSSDKYHLPWCSGAKRIKPENLISFGSIAEAEKAGYKPAGNCPGLK